MTEFLDVLKTRRSIRSYTADPVSEDDLRDLIALAVMAPTGMNSQPWSFSVVTDREVMRQLNSNVVEMLRGPEVKKLLANEGLREIFERPDFDIFYNAPALIAISGDRKAPTAQIDCQLAAENLFLAAHARGLGTCYMGFLLMAGENPEVRRLLRVPEGHNLLAAAVIGHPDRHPEGLPDRRPAVIEWIR